MDKGLLFVTRDGVEIFANTSHTIFIIDKDKCTMETLLPYWIQETRIYNKNSRYENGIVFYSKDNAFEWRKKKINNLLEEVKKEHVEFRRLFERRIEEIDNFNR